MAMPRVVILGAGFGGLFAAKRLAGAEADVTVVDRHNYHLFQPLLYQVATAGLPPSDIAWPIRSILSRQKNASVLLDEVVDIDVERHKVILQKGLGGAGPRPQEYRRRDPYSATYFDCLRTGGDER
jgi:NADH dehydrogenase